MELTTCHIQADGDIILSEMYTTQRCLQQKPVFWYRYFLIIIVKLQIDLLFRSYSLQSRRHLILMTQSWRHDSQLWAAINSIALEMKIVWHSTCTRQSM